MNAKKKRRVENIFGAFDLCRYEMPQEFTCAICEALGKKSEVSLKKSKIKVVWTTVAKKLHSICNGCYGTALLKARSANESVLSGRHDKFIEVLKRL